MDTATILNRAGLYYNEVSQDVYEIDPGVKTDVVLLGTMLKDCLLISDVEYKDGNDGERHTEISSLYYVITSASNEVRQQYIDTAKKKYGTVLLRKYSSKNTKELNMPIYSAEEVED